MQTRWIVWLVLLVLFFLAEWRIFKQADQEEGQAMPVGDLTFLGCGVIGIASLLFLALWLWLF